METMYKLNAQELTSDFVASVRSIFLDRETEIIVREASVSEDEDSAGNSRFEQMDETEYLLQSPANRKHILEAVKNVEEGKNIRYFENMDDVIAFVRSKTET